MRSVVERAVRHTPGGDLWFGGLVLGIGVALWFGVETVAATRTMPLEVGVVRAVGISITVPITALILVGTSARVGRDETGTDEPAQSRSGGISDGRLLETARITVNTLQDRGTTLLVAAVIAAVAGLLVGALVAVVLLAVVLSVLTIAGYTAYTLGYGQLLSAVTMFYIAGVLAGIGLSVGVLSVRFFDCIVCWTDAGPLTAVRESIRCCWNRPLTVLGYAIVTTVLFAIPLVAGAAVALVHDPLGLGILVVLAVVSVALYANVHAQVCYHLLLPACCEPVAAEPPTSAQPTSDAPVQSHAVPNRPLVGNPLAVVLALMLVTALLAGSGTVRALDVRPADSLDEPGPVDEIETPAALVGADTMPQGEASFRAVEANYKYNESQDRWEQVVEWEYEVDRQQRRSVIVFTIFEGGEPSQSNTAYFSTKQLAMQWIDHQEPQPLSSSADRAWHKRTAEHWMVYSVAGYELLGDDSELISVTAAFFNQEWQVVDQSDETITVEAAGADAVPLNEQRYGAVEEATIELTIDRETGYVMSVVQKVERADDDLAPLRTSIEFEHWGNHTVDRPDEFDVRPVEWLWGVASY